MACIGSRNYWSSFRATVTSALEIKLSFFSICSMMELTGNFKKPSAQWWEVWDNILMLMLWYRIKNTHKNPRSSWDSGPHLQWLETISICWPGINLSKEISSRKIISSKRSVSILENSGSVVSTIGDLSLLAKMESYSHLRSLESQSQYSHHPGMTSMMTTMSKVWRRKLEASLKEDLLSTLKEWESIPSMRFKSISRMRKLTRHKINSSGGVHSRMLRMKSQISPDKASPPCTLWVL